MPKVEFAVEDAMRNNNAIGPGREVVVKCLECLIATNAALAIKLPKVLLRLAVD